MFGTIATLKPAPGEEGELLAILEEWGRERGASIAGPIRVYIARSERDPGVLLNIAPSTRARPTARTPRTRSRTRGTSAWQHV